MGRDLKAGLSLLLVLFLCTSFAVSEGSPDVFDEGSAVTETEDLAPADGELIISEAEDIAPAGVEVADINTEGLELSEGLFCEEPDLREIEEEELPAPEEQSINNGSYAVDAVDNAVCGSYGVDPSSKGYATSINPFFKKGYSGECTWYCWGRAYEKCGVKLSWSNNDVFGNAKYWYRNAKSWAESHNVDYAVGTEPRENSIAVSAIGTYGHVVFIEKIEDGYVCYSEYNGKAGYHKYGEGKKPLSDLPYTGYIYLRWIVASGKCGDDLDWKLYNDRVLEISGSGTMWDFDEETPCPWHDCSWDADYEDTGDHVSGINVDRVVIHGGVTSIGSGAFGGMSLKSVSIPDSVVDLGEGAFANCCDLTGIDLPDGIKTIPYDAFSDCTSLSKVKLPSHLEVIGKGAFWETKIQSIDLPDSLSEIHPLALGHTHLKSVHIPENVTLVDSMTFLESSELSGITVASGSKTYAAKNNALYTVEKDMLILCAPNRTGAFTVPKSVRYIGAVSFACTRLTDIVLPDGVRSIGSMAFEKADDLNSVNLPASLVSISDDAFLYCEYGGHLDKLTVSADYGSYALQFCRAHDAGHPRVKYPDEEGLLENYVVTKKLTRSGSNGTVNLYAGEKLKLTAVGKSGACPVIKSWETSDPKSAKVSKSGMVKAVGVGESTIRVTPVKGKAMTLTVKVTDPYTPTKVRLNRSGTIKLKKGKTLQLKASVLPSTASTTLTWSSGNSNIAKVSKKGKVTAVKKGTVTITVRTGNGKSARVKIKVI